MKNFILELHSKDNINRSQVASIAKLVVEHLFQPLSSLMVVNKADELIDNFTKIKLSLASLSTEYNLISSLVKEKSYIVPQTRQECRNCYKEA